MIMCRSGEERSPSAAESGEERLLDEGDNKENISRSQRDGHLASERRDVEFKWEWRGLIGHL